MSCFNPCCPGSIPSTGGRCGRSVPSECVSILVVLDLSHRPGTGVARSHVEMEFQSLLSWIYPIDTKMSCWTPSGRSRFQSLLSWIYPIDAAKTIGPGGEEMFQSLLSWIYPIDRRPKPSAQAERRCFNPCCPGSIPSTPQSQHGALDRRLVSILVVLDLSHRQPQGPG